MIKKTIAFLTVIAAAIGTMFGLAACNTKEKVSVDPKVLNVRIYKAGYGTEYIKAIGNEFEKTFASKGYKINVLTPTRDTVGENVYKEIYSDGGIDVYFTTANMVQAISGQYGQSFADITESVYAKPAVKFDGTEEAETIGDKIAADSMKYNLSYDGKQYGLPYIKDIGALAVNTKALADYDLELPRTSNELFDCFSTIMAEAKDTGVFPWTYVSGLNNYPAHFTNTWLAQYMGIDDFEAFWSMEKDGVRMTDNGYEVFKSDAINATLKYLYKLFDYNVATAGSATQDVTQAQYKFLRGDAVFYSVGGWLLQEESERSAGKLKDVTFIPIPVISDLGVNVFGAGTGYDFDADKCDEVLSEIAKRADENESVADIKTALDAKYSASFAESDVKRICEARGYTYSRSEESCIVVSEKSQKKDVAAEFLRFCASVDAGKLIAEKTMNSSPFAPGANDESEYPFLRAQSKITSNVYFRGFSAVASGYRQQLGFTTVFPYTGIYVQNTILKENLTIYKDGTYEVIKTDDVFAAAADKLADTIYQRGLEDWANWKK